MHNHPFERPQYPGMKQSLRDELSIAQRNADFPAVERLAREAIAQSGAPGDEIDLGNAYCYLGGAMVARHDARAAVDAYNRSLEAFTRIGNRTGMARATNGLGVVSLDLEAQVAHARERFERALPWAREGDDRHLVGVILGNLCEALRFEAQYRAAIACADEALAIMLDIGDLPRAAWQKINVAHCHLLRGRRDEAMSSMHAAYEYLTREGRDARIVAWYFEVWFIILASLHKWEPAATIYGFVQRLRDERGIVRLQTLMPWLSSPTEAMWRSLRPDRVEELLNLGARLSMEDAERLAREGAL